MNLTKVKNVDGKVGEGVEFERSRRIMGYLVGDTKNSIMGRGQNWQTESDMA